MNNKPILCLALAGALTGGVLPAAAPGRGRMVLPGLVPQRAQGPGDPVVFKAGTATEGGWREQETRWMEKHLLPVITKGWEGQPWREEALKFVGERLPRMQYLSTWGSAIVDFKISGASLLAAGCKDPWIRLWEAWDRQDEGFDAEKDLPVMFQALKEIRETVKEPALLRFAALPLIQQVPAYPKSGPTMERRAEITEDFTKWTGSLGKSPCYGPEDAGQLYRHVRGIPTRRTAPAGYAERLEEAGTLPVWITDSMIGEDEIDRAWKKRGTKFAGEVTEEGWRGFEKHLALARKRLTAAWKARPDQPFAAASMITVVMGGSRESGESERLWFNRSTAACFDYRFAYHKYEYSLVPRWGGSHEDMLAFGFACMDSGHLETDAPLGLLRAVSEVGKELNAYDKVYAIPGVGERVKKLNAALLKAAATPQDMADRRSHIMLDSWFLRDWETGREALNANDGKFTPAVDGRMFKLATTVVKIGTDLSIFGLPERAAAREADEKERSGDPAAAVPLWKKTLEGFDGRDWLKEAIQARLRAAELRRDYLEGQWVKVPVDHAKDWEQLQGDWDVVKDKGFTVTREFGTGVQLVSYPLPLGEQFELRAKVRLSGGGAHGRPPCLMLGAGFNPCSYFSALTVAAEITEEGVSGFFGENSYNNPHSPRIQVSSKPAEKLEMYLRRKNGKLTFAINGATVFEDSEETSGDPDWENGILSVGACQLADDSRLIIESVEAHRLP
ncbi:MAG: hypothetical protein V4726_05550 [Verrucomicrobiota bacterium]